MRKRWGFRVVFLIGFLLCCLPTVFNFITRKKQAEAVATYQSAVEKEDSSLEDTRADAQLYNSMLWQSGEAVVDSLDTGILSDESYVSQMDVSGSGIMGSLDIPKINVELPIRHGTTRKFCQRELAISREPASLWVERILTAFLPDTEDCPAQNC